MKDSARSASRSRPTWGTSTVCVRGPGIGHAAGSNAGQAFSLRPIFNRPAWAQNTRPSGSISAIGCESFLSAIGGLRKEIENAQSRICAKERKRIRRFISAEREDRFGQLLWVERQHLLV